MFFLAFVEEHTPVPAAVSPLESSPLSGLPFRECAGPRKQSSPRRQFRWPRSSAPQTSAFSIMLQQRDAVVHPPSNCLPSSFRKATGPDSNSSHLQLLTAATVNLKGLTFRAERLKPRARCIGRHTLLEGGDRYRYPTVINSCGEACAVSGAGDSSRKYLRKGEVWQRNRTF